jgi:hypothetical protein
MQPGDLVKLVHDGLGDVCVAAIDNSAIWSVDHGAVAVFIDEYHWLNERGCEKKLMILVEGRTGWIYESECEVLNETG